MSSPGTNGQAKGGPEPGTRPTLRMTAYQVLSVARYSDGTQRAHTAVWNADSGKMTFHALSDPARPMTQPHTVVQALLTAAQELSVDTAGGQLPLW